MTPSFLHRRLSTMTIEERSPAGKIPLIVNCQLSTVNFQLSTFNYHESTAKSF
ncbi:MAG: hypothetical protein HC786_28655 [Richelia sp. CSU_2_1]|nr:hypothetical protein [Richelia sp. CSU_2_1]